MDNIKIETLDKCTLLQACEWMAFYWLPIIPVYEALEKRPEFRNDHKNQYDTKIREKALHLYAALLDNKLIATGLRRFKKLEFISIGEFLEPCTSEDKKMFDKEVRKLKEQEKKRICILNFQSKTKINIAENKIIPSSQNIAYYHKIEIDFYELQKTFPKTKEKRGRKKELSEPEIAKLIDYARTHKGLSQQTIIKNCAEWTSKNLNKHFSYEGMRGYLKSYFLKLR